MNEPKQSKITIEITRTEWHEDELSEICDPGARVMRLQLRVPLGEQSAEVLTFEMCISSHEWRHAAENGTIEEIKNYYEREAWHKVVPELREHFPIAEEPKRELKLWEIFPDGDYEGGINRMLSGESDEP